MQNRSAKTLVVLITPPPIDLEGRQEYARYTNVSLLALLSGSLKFKLLLSTWCNTYDAFLVDKLPSLKLDAKKASIVSPFSSRGLSCLYLKLLLLSNRKNMFSSTWYTRVDLCMVTRPRK